MGAADACFARFPDRADELSAEGGELFDDALGMFEALRGTCEAVYIATGIPSHAPLTIAAAEAGYHVHLEKPPAARPTPQRTSKPTQMPHGMRSERAVEAPRPWLKRIHVA